MFKFIFRLVFISILFMNICVAEQSLYAFPKPQMAPDFSLYDMDGEKHSLADFKGKTVIVNFWATWCPPCREEMPSMERAWNKLKDHDVIMLAINVGEDEDTVFTFLGDYPVSFTILFDTSGTMIEQWPVKGLPTTFVVSPEGKLVYRAIGGREWDDADLLKKVQELNQ
ncbi:MAG: TlpA family protein disulfide reductase [Gammaproteobacteria bacterium]|nr:TlpA family protein disulfide reductase [Gammaproteobacteria bacterium]